MDMAIVGCGLDLGYLGSDVCEIWSKTKKTRRLQVLDLLIVSIRVCGIYFELGMEFLSSWHESLQEYS